MIPDRDRPIAVEFTETDLLVTLPNQRHISIPLADYPILLQAPSQERSNVQLGLGGIYWPDLKLEISLLELLGSTALSTGHHKPHFCEG